MSAEEIAGKLKILLEDAVVRNLGEGLLLSGGFDTSLIAALAVKHGAFKCFTVAFRDGPAPDLEYAKKIAEKFGLQHSIRVFDQNELFQAVPKVVKILGVFDPMEIRNSLAIYLALESARDAGVKTVMTGDACDELFAGYSFFFKLDEHRLQEELEKMWAGMSFSSVPMARTLNMEARLPFLDPEFMSYAKSVPANLKVRKDRGDFWGKWILRKAFEDLLPESVIWRVKTPIESGTGTTILPQLFEKRILDNHFQDHKQKALKQDGVKLRDKEQAYYYMVYRSIFGPPKPKNDPAKNCPECNSTVPERTVFCRICGAYPI